ncbi:MAG TPA: phenylalanine--tRNA ligase beta subunit-related protein [Candidatus Acidoferrales bacterium]|nr:phenylalanine--tRNA ligase beta subunit-related protein [Candidatus Acidoferrales bacterium]
MTDIEIQIPAVKLGIVEADGAAVSPAGPELVREIGAVCESLRRKFTLESLAESESVVAVRAMFRRWGVDASKYRPSAEALLRRVVQGKGLYNVSNIVDLSNLGSIETGWPYSVYNRIAIQPPVCLRLGANGETYEGIGRRVWHLAGRPVLADAVGPFGSPISDSTRTQVIEGVSEMLTVIYAPATASDAAISEAVAKQAQRLKLYAGARETRSGRAG